MRLSDAGLRRHPTELIYPDHRLPPWLNEDATRDRSNRLLDVYGTGDRSASIAVPQFTRWRARINLTNHRTRVVPAAPEIDQPGDKCNGEHGDYCGNENQY